MGKRYRFGVIMLLLSLVALICFCVIHWNGLDVLNPAGSIAFQERKLIFFTLALSLLVIVPVFAMLFGFAWKYREDGKATYTPEWDHSLRLEAVWWGLPIMIISILGVVTWKSTHALDPYKPLASNNKPLTIQVIALQWKWLFIYPEQNIASVNLLEIPVDRPINFQITSDAPMNSFWIPKLGGQIYAMSGMSSELHLKADKMGDYKGMSANISGTGFSQMTFITKARSNQDYQAWISAVKKSGGALVSSNYQKLATPSTIQSSLTFGSVKQGLYEDVLEKYMAPAAAKETDMK